MLEYPSIIWFFLFLVMNYDYNKELRKILELLFSFSKIIKYVVISISNYYIYYNTLYYFINKNK